jgi:hypothetical protein
MQLVLFIFVIDSCESVHSSTVVVFLCLWWGYFVVGGWVLVVWCVCMCVWGGVGMGDDCCNLQDLVFKTRPVCYVYIVVL